MAIDINTDGFLSYKSDWMIFLVFFSALCFEFHACNKIIAAG